MRIQLAVLFDVQDEARFLSHHDMMRLVERLVARAKLPVKFSQGFNPRPKMSLPLPRPVGVAGHEELLILELEQPLPEEEAALRLSAVMPEGIRLDRCEFLPPGRTIRAEKADFILPVSSETVPALQQRLVELEGLTEWPILRRNLKAPLQEKVMDLRPLLREPVLEGQTLRFSLVPNGQVWARVEEAMNLLGLDPQTDRARLVRTTIWEQTER